MQHKTLVDGQNFVQSIEHNKDVQKNIEEGLRIINSQSNYAHQLSAGKDAGNLKKRVENLYSEMYTKSERSTNAYTMDDPEMERAVEQYMEDVNFINSQFMTVVDYVSVTTRAQIGMNQFMSDSEKNKQAKVSYDALTDAVKSCDGIRSFCSTNGFTQVINFDTEGLDGRANVMDFAADLTSQFYEDGKYLGLDSNAFYATIEKSDMMKHDSAFKRVGQRIATMADSAPLKSALDFSDMGVDTSRLTGSCPGVATSFGFGE